MVCSTIGMTWGVSGLNWKCLDKVTISFYYNYCENYPLKSVLKYADSLITIEAIPCEALGSHLRSSLGKTMYWGSITAWGWFQISLNKKSSLTEVEGLGLQGKDQEEKEGKAESNWATHCSERDDLK